MTYQGYLSELITLCHSKNFVLGAKLLMETKPIKRVMIANIKPGERITYITFQRSLAIRVEGEVTHVEFEYKLGRLWTTHGPLPWQPLTAKYEVRM